MLVCDVALINIIIYMVKGRLLIFWYSKYLVTDIFYMGFIKKSFSICICILYQIEIYIIINIKTYNNIIKLERDSKLVSTI